MQEQQSTNIDTGLTEQLSGLGSFLLPPGLYTPEPATPLGMQAGTHSHHFKIREIWMLPI